LTRIWAYAPALGNELAKFSRRYFFSGAVLAYAIISAYAWAQFPYDNICDPSEETIVRTGNYSGTALNGTAIAYVEVEQSTTVEYCSQRWNNFDGFVFPPTSRVQPAGKQWMNDSQETLTDTYGYTALAMLIGFIIIFFGSAIVVSFRSLFGGVYVPEGQDQHIDFSAYSEIFGYVPQIKWPGFPFQFLACDIDQIDQSLIGWNDPAHSYDYHNLMFDVPWEGLPRKTKMDENTRTTTRIAAQDEFQVGSTHATSSSPRPIFSIIKHYPPDWAWKLQDMQDEN
jgi:hypothetical protein